MDIVTVILVFSILLQGAAVVLALRLIPLTGRALAWILLSLAFFLMFARRGISLLYGWGFIESEWQHALTTEMVAIAISLLIVSGVYLIGRFFREHQRHAALLEHQTLHDPLTGLPNRSHLLRLLNDAIAGHGPFALLVMDLDQFKEVNDTLGHRRGDQILHEAAARLRTALPGGRRLARLGGDEFAAILPGTGLEAARGGAQRLLGTLVEPFRVEGHLFNIGASVGIALFPRHGTDGETLLQRADVAMYTAKRRATAIEAYDPSQDSHSLERLALAAELHAAIDKGGLRLHYQPLVDLKSGAITGVEALLRWPHSARGPRPPDEFVAVAERSGLIRPLTRWVLNAALGQCHAWHQVNLPLGMAVNLSARTLHDENLPGDLDELLHKWQVAPSCLVLEITESTIMADPARAQAVLARLHRMGVRLAIDDFGTGYSSLAYLKTMPVSLLKVDKSFVSDMNSDDNDAVIVRSTIDLAHNLGLKIMAEGVEDRATLDLLAILGCDAAQGIYFAPALPAAEFEAFARDWSSRRRAVEYIGPLLSQCSN